VTLVVDASVAIKWVVPEPGSEEADLLLAGDHALEAPDLLASEAANTLWKKTARGELSPRHAREALDVLLHGGLTWHPTSPLLPRALELARLSRHPVYDCVYLALAESVDGAVVTADESLLRIARARRIGARTLASFRR
jgi:predicted nucleic acid-binding protein